MKFTHRVLLAAVTAFSAISAIHASAAPEDQLKTLAEFRFAYAQSLRQGNIDSLAGYYAENIRLMAEFQRTVVGRTDAFSYYRAFAGRFEVQAYRRDVIDLLDLGTGWIESGTFVMKLTLKGGGRTYELNGKYLDLWEKAANGKLGLQAQAWNYDQSVEIGDDLRFTDVPAFVAAFHGRVPVTTDVRFELAAMGRLIEVAVTQHDAPLFSRFYADDAVLLPNYSVACRGRQEIDAYVVDHFQHLQVFEKLDIRNDRVEEWDGYVIECARHLASWKNGDSSGVSIGKNLRIWRREPNHSLKIVRQIGSYD